MTDYLGQIDEAFFGLMQPREPIVFTSPSFYLLSCKFIQKIIEKSDLLDGRTCLTDFVTLFGPYLKCKITSGHYLDVIFCVIEKFQIADVDIIKNSIGHFFALKFTAYCAKCERSYYPSPFTMDPISCEHRRHMLLFSGTTYSYCNRLKSFEDFEVMKRLLRYGQRIDFKEEDVRHILRASIENVLLPPRREGSDLSLNRSKWDDIFNDCRSSATGARRLLLAALAVRFVELKRWDDEDPRRSRYQYYRTSEKAPCWGFAKSLKLLFKTITDPLISLDEIQSLFDAVIVGESKVQKITELCSTIVEEFPRSVEPLQPRSLKHLSRCCIRDCLSSSYKLPFGVRDLPLPKYLKNYILIQRKEDEFLPRLLLTEIQYLQRLNRIKSIKS